MQVSWRGRTRRTDVAHKRQCQSLAGAGYRDGVNLFETDGDPWQAPIQPQEPQRKLRELEMWRHYEQNVLQGFLDAAQKAGQAVDLESVIFDKD